MSDDHDLEGLGLTYVGDERDDPDAIKSLCFELANDLLLGVYDTEQVGSTLVIRLTPPEFDPATLGGTEPDAYVRLAAAILEYAGGPDSGDHPGLKDDFVWKFSVRSLAKTVEKLGTVTE